MDCPQHVCHWASSRTWQRETGFLGRTLPTGPQAPYLGPSGKQLTCGHWLFSGAGRSRLWGGALLPWRILHLFTAHNKGALENSSQAQTEEGCTRRGGSFLGSPVCPKSSLCPRGWRPLGLTATRNWLALCWGSWPAGPSACGHTPPHISPCRLQRSSPWGSVTPCCGVLWIAGHVTDWLTESVNGLLLVTHFFFSKVPRILKTETEKSPLRTFPTGFPTRHPLCTWVSWSRVIQANLITPQEPWLSSMKHGALARWISSPNRYGHWK